MEALQNLLLAVFPAETGGGQQQTENAAALTPFASILPFLTALTLTADPKEKALRYLVEKGRPTLPMKLVEKAWNLEFVEMEEFLPAPRSLRLAEQGKPALSLQDSPVGALNQFQAIQSQKSQRCVQTISTWIRCFTLYIAVMAKKKTDMIPCMVVHLHTVLKLQQKECGASSSGSSLIETLTVVFCLSHVEAVTQRRLQTITKPYSHQHM